MERYVDILVRYASTVAGKHRLAAMVVDHRGKPVAFGVNSYHKTHPFQAKLASFVAPQKIYLHAEIHAIIQALRRNTNLGGIMVIRIDRRGQLKKAKPCDICMVAIRLSGIPTLIYSDDGGLVMSEVDDDGSLPPLHVLRL